MSLPTVFTQGGNNGWFPVWGIGGIRGAMVHRHYTDEYLWEEVVCGGYGLCLLLVCWWVLCLWNGLLVWLSGISCVSTMLIGRGLSGYGVVLQEERDFDAYTIRSDWRFSFGISFS